MRPSSGAIVAAVVFAATFLVACGGGGGIKADGADGADGDAGDAPVVFSCADAGGGACNDNPIVSSIWGVCAADGRCHCNTGFAINPDTGKCRLADATTAALDYVTE